MAQSDKPRESSEGKRELQRSPGGGISRAERFPGLFSMSPREFFGTNPFEMMRRFTDEMDRAFSGFGRQEGRAWSPAIEVQQKGDNMIVRAELPGLKKDEVKVEVTDEGLVIQGERKREEEKREEGFYRSERSYGRFYRLIPLPEDAKVDEAKANFADGVLEVTIPAPQSARHKRREIQIQTSERTRTAGGGD